MAARALGSDTRFVVCAFIQCLLLLGSLQHTHAEPLIHNVCDYMNLTTVSVPLYLTSSSFFAINEDIDTCQCHVTGTALSLRGLASFFSTNTTLDFTFGEGDARNNTSYHPKELAFNYTTNRCNPGATNVSSTCPVNVTIRGGVKDMFWIEITDTGNDNITLKCNNYNRQTTSQATTRPTEGATTQADVGDSYSKSPDVGPIVGAFFGGAAFMALVAIVVYLIFTWCRARSSKGVTGTGVHIPKVFMRGSKGKGNAKGIRISQLVSLNANSPAVVGGLGAADRNSVESESYSGLDATRSDSHKYGEMSLSVNKVTHAENGKKQSQSVAARPESDMYIPMEGDANTGRPDSNLSLPKGGNPPKPPSDAYVAMNVPVGDRKTLTQRPSETGSEMYMAMEEPPSEQAPRPPSHPPPGSKRVTTTEEPKEKPKAVDAKRKQPDRPQTQHPAQKPAKKRPSNSDSQVYKPPDNDQDDDDEPSYGNTIVEADTKAPAVDPRQSHVAVFYVSEGEDDADAEEIYQNEDGQEEYVEVTESPQPRGKSQDQDQGRRSNPEVYVEEEEAGDENLYENPDDR